MTTHIPQTEHFSFQSMLYVHHNFGGPHGPAKAKVINHTILSYCLKMPTTFRFFRIRATDHQNSQETQPDITPTLKQVKIFFQNTGTPDSD